MRISFTYLSFAALLIALLSLAGAWFFYSDIQSRVAARSAELSSSNAQSAQQVSAIEVHAIAEDTASDRAALDQDVSTDVVGIANAIQSAGQAAGTKTQIGSATSLSQKSASSGVSELEFVVQSTGSFAQVWRAAELFGTLPLPSSLEEVDFEQIQNGSSGATWQLTAHIAVLTSAQVSS